MKYSPFNIVTFFCLFFLKIYKSANRSCSDLSHGATISFLFLDLGAISPPRDIVMLWHTPFGPSTHTHARAHTHTYTHTFVKCLNRSLCGYMASCSCTCCLQVSGSCVVAMLELMPQGFTGSSLGCGGSRAAPLCEVLDQTASWWGEMIV